MNNINLSYINAKSLTELLATPNLNMEHLVNDIYDLIIDDVSLANSYVSKYDNPGDKAEGTSVEELKSQLEIIENNLTKLRCLKINVK